MRKLAGLVILLATTAAASPAGAQPPASEAPASAASAVVDCKRERISCSGLQTCAQACAYLHQCGIGKLDRDKDGVPCESLCTKTCDTPG